MDDPNNGLDFGLGDKPSAVSNFRKSIFGEKGASHKHQLSMDMDMSTPYLLPPQLHGSKESLHSLAHSVQTPEDPYRPVGQYSGSDVGSLRSMRRGPGGGGDQSSLFTSTSTRSGPGRGAFSPTNSQFPRPPPPAADPYQHRPSPAPAQSPQSPRSPLSSFDFRADPLVAQPDMGQSHARSSPYPEDQSSVSKPGNTDAPTLDMPPMNGVGISVQGQQSHPSANIATPMSATIERASTANPLSAHPEPQQAQMGDVRDFSIDGDSIPQRTTSQEQQGPPAVAAPARESYYSDDNNSTHVPQIHSELEHEPRGRRTTRFLDDDALRTSQYLTAPQFEDRRQSVGMRPLPPTEVMDTEDPEHRANRIRSFYKEYFEVESGPAPPLPTNNPVDPTRRVPSRPPPQDQDVGGYYEDYDGNYLENTYIDQASNSFVMPYAQPVHRRAMTPPPRGPRMRGPPPPRIMHGSMGGMSLQAGRGPFRPGSATSSHLGPRPDSSASARPIPRGKPMPPPAALTTLPNPAKLGDDTFALLSASDFAPPDSLKDRVAGRSQSPVPEKRAYHLAVPIHSPLAGSHDELPVMPSP
jgi:hypothetical protein